MTLKTVPVTGTLYNPNGSAAANASVVATLTVVDTDAGIVVPSQVTATADSNGVFTLNLWPNSRGVNGSQYRVRAQMPGALPGVLLVNLLITVPDSDPAVSVPISTITNRTGPAALSDAKAAMLAAQGFALQASGVIAAVTSAAASVAFLYPGTSASAPTTRPDGTSIQNGDRYNNSTDGTEYIRINGVWTNAASSAAAAAGSAAAASSSATGAATSATSSATARDAALAAQRIYVSAAAGDAATSAGQYYYVISAQVANSLELWLHNGAGGTDTGKRMPSASSVAANASNIADVSVKSRSMVNLSVPGPETIFGSNLVSYYDPHSNRFNSDGSLYTGGSLLKRMYGAGLFPKLTTIDTGAGTVTSQVDGSDIYSFLQRSPYVMLNTQSGMGAAFLGGTAPFFFFAGPATYDTSASPSVYWATATWRLAAYNNAGTLTFELQENVATVWTMRWRWTTNYTAALASTLQGFTSHSVEWRWDGAAATLAVNATVLPPVASTAGLTIVPADITIGQIEKVYCLAFASNSAPGDGARLKAYLERLLPQEGDSTARPDWAGSVTRVPEFRNLLPRPATVFGPYAADLSRLTLGATVTSPVFPAAVVPASPNVTPFDTADRQKLDWSTTRFCPMPHPSFPADPTKLVLLVHGMYQPANPASYADYMLVYESTNSGAIWTPFAVASPAASLPADTTSVVNNILFSGWYGRALYIGDVFPNGYTPPGSALSFKYLLLFETIAGGSDGQLWGCNDPRVRTDWTRIDMNSWPLPHPANTRANTSMGVEQVATPGVAAKPSLEEKGLFYDRGRRRFFRIIKTRDRGFKPNRTYTTDYTIRNLRITWSEVDDCTRWNPVQPLMVGPNSGYQHYDCDVVQINHRMWILFDYRYCDYNTTPAPVGSPNAARNRMSSVDLYYSMDGFATPPIMVREDFISNAAQPWASAYANAAAHPAGNGKFYLSAGSTLHGADPFTLKVGLVTYTFPTASTPTVPVVPDRMVADGYLATSQFVGALVKYVRLEAGGGSRRVRVLDASGRTIPGFEFQESLHGMDQIVRWNGSSELPKGLISIEVELREGAAVNGIYPVPV